MRKSPTAITVEISVISCVPCEFESARSSASV
eukprot:SAG11_NODE_20438_length_445_cov_0.745665_1_plen_31_part_10